jgi:hypothetical protein
MGMLEDGRIYYGVAMNGVEVLFKSKGLFGCVYHCVPLACGSTNWNGKNWIFHQENVSLYKNDGASVISTSILKWNTVKEVLPEELPLYVWMPVHTDEFMKILGEI